jgi:predicted RNase H-like nuclease (RuvC/YqgF family)
MNPLEEHLQRINEKMQQLLKLYQLQQKENERLKKELEQVKSLEADKGRQIDDLEQKVAVLKTATNNMSEADKKELEKRINQYLKEIDRCIEMLSE